MAVAFSRASLLSKGGRQKSNYSQECTMKNTKLNWFDRLMVNITFAEANVQKPVITKEDWKDACRNNVPGERILDACIKDGCASASPVS